VADWCKRQGYENTMSRVSKTEAPACIGLAQFILLNRLKEKLGLDKCKGYLYGAAPMKRTSIEYFASLDFLLTNIYGMSETTASTTCHFLDKKSLYYAGVPAPGTQMKIHNPDENGVGEICMRGRNMMMGYLKNEQATRDTKDIDGFIHSGDIGCLTQEGFLKITGRIKELIITAGGENIAPILIEDKFKEFCIACSNIMVIGDYQKFLSALITLKTEIDPKTGKPTNQIQNEIRHLLQRELGVKVKTTEEAAKNEKILKYI